MWVFGPALFEIMIRTVIVYGLVLIGFRLSGKRETGQMTPFDLVLVLLIANAVQNAMTGPDTSITGGLTAVVTLLLLNTGVSLLVDRSRKTRKLLEGSPTILVRNGIPIQKNFTKEKITMDEMHQALREHGIASLTDVGLAVLEIDGTISVLQNDELPTVTKPHHHIRFTHR
jgi:uncharacterized membrane protein YcaP (DUF421 family)